MSNCQTTVCDGALLSTKETPESVAVRPLFASLFDKIRLSKRSGIDGTIQWVKHAVCVVRNDSDHQPEQRGWKIMAHSLDDPYFGSPDIGRRVHPCLRGN